MRLTQNGRLEKRTLKLNCAGEKGHALQLFQECHFFPIPFHDLMATERRVNSLHMTTSVKFPNAVAVQRPYVA